MALGWMRYKHLQRSRPIERDDVVVWFRCSAGKTPSQKQGFEWCLPRSYGSTSAADILWDAWHARAAVAQTQQTPLPEGLIADPVTGAPVELKQFNKLLKEDLRFTLLCPDEEAGKFVVMASVASALPFRQSSICHGKRGWRRGAGPKPPRPPR